MSLYNNYALENIIDGKNNSGQKESIIFLINFESEEFVLIKYYPSDDSHFTMSVSFNY